APTLGSGIMWLTNWRMIFVVQGIYAAVMILSAWRFLPEIKPANSSHQIDFLKGYVKVFSNPAARPLIATVMFASFAFFCFVTALPFVYIQYFGVSEHLFGVLFAANVSVLMLANWLNSRQVTRRGSMTMLRIGL